MTQTSNFHLFSIAFKDGAHIPDKYSANGQDINPPLDWNNPPSQTKSFALICEDPDAPKGTWYHWLVKDIPSSTKHIDENSIPGKELLNSWAKRSWGGPSPPSGTHRYIFKLFALNTNTLKADNPKDFYSEVNKHLLDTATYTGLYSKK
jgi:Raf kinase inhibitor-like YbhB/YbcL family protein